MKRAITHLSANDKILAGHIRSVGPCRIRRERAGTPFLALAESITYQQLSGKAAETIWGRVLALYGSERSFTARAVLKTPDERFRSAGLSASKTASLKSLAEHTEARIVPGWAALERLDDETILERLTEVRGVGPWTVQMLLIFSLRRPDVLPSTDYGVQKGFSILYNTDLLPKPKELLSFGERWKPYRSYAAWYLWRATDQKGGRA